MTLSRAENPIPCFPEDIFEKTPNGKVWWVAVTRPRSEKSLARYLLGCQIGYFLPMVKKRQASENRQRYSLVPLYGGYLFFMADLEGRYQALRSNLIKDILEVKDQERFIQEIRSIHITLRANQMLYPCPTYEVGQEVYINKGPLKGVTGVIVRKERNMRLLLRITSLALACYINVAEDMVA